VSTYGGELLSLKRATRRLRITSLGGPVIDDARPLKIGMDDVVNVHLSMLARSDGLSQHLQGKMRYPHAPMKGANLLPNVLITSSNSGPSFPILFRKVRHRCLFKGSVAKLSVKASGYSRAVPR